MTDIFVGSVAVGVVPDARGWEDRMRQQLLPPSRKVGDEVGKEIGDSVESGMAEAGDKSAKDFGEMFKVRIKEMMDTLPKVQLDGDATPIDRKLDEIKIKLMILSKTNLLDSKKAIQNLTIVEADVKALADMAKGVKLDFNTKDALGKIAELRLAESKILLGDVAGGKATKGPTVASLEAAISTASGAASAGTGVLGNIMAFFGGIKGFFGGGGGGSGGGGGIVGAAAGAPAAGGGGGGGLAALGGLAGPIGIGAAVVAAAPFIGQIVGGAIVGVMGSALLGLGLAGAAMTGKLSAPFKSLTKQISDDMKQIGTPFVAPLREVMKEIAIVTHEMTPIFVKASKILGVPFQKFLDAIVRAFGQKSVQTSILAVANAFQSILTAVTPSIGRDVGTLANSMTKLANTIAANPQAMANVFNYIVSIINFLIASTADLAKIAVVIEKWHGGAAGHAVAATTRHTTEAVKGVVDVNNALWDLGTGNIPATRRAAGAAGRAINQSVTFQKSATPGWAQAFSNQSMSHVVDDVRIFFVSLGRNIGHWATIAWDTSISAIVHTWQRGHNLMVGWGHDIAHWFDDVKRFFIVGWNTVYNTTVQWIIHTWQHGHNLMVGWGHDIAHWFDDVKGAFEKGWNWVYDHTIGAIIRLIAHAGSLFDGWYHNVLTWFTNTENAFITAWDIIYNDTIGAIIRLTGRAMTLFTGWKTNIINWGKDALTWLLKMGSDLIAGFKNGIVGAMKDVASWGYNDIVKPVINFLLSPTGFSIHSPSRKMIPIGRQIITGIIHGMIGEGKNIGHFVAKVFGSWPHAIMSYLSKGLINMGQIMKLPSKAIASLGGVLGFAGRGIGAAVSGFWHMLTGGGGGNVAKWAGTVSRALTMLGLPQSLSGAVLYQMQTESGGNVNAINLTDINAKRGDPSRGLMQVIGSTFSQYHVPGTSWNIYDPLANITSALNYARHVYGPNLANSRGGIGSGHGYDSGGWLPTGVTLAYNMTGQPERILSPTELKAMAAGGAQYHAHFDGLTGAAIESHVRTAFQLMNMQQGNLYRQGRRS